MAETAPLPPLRAGARRGLLRLLVGSAVLHAALAVTTALLVGALVSSPSSRVLPFAVATGLALAGMGATKYAERVLAERLGQDYVHELRGRLVSLALSGRERPSLGITIARATNDLSAVRSWVAQGIAPLVAAVPLVLGSVVVLGVLDWHLAAATLLPLAALAGVLALVARLAYRRARTLRRRRGRLASVLSDTLHARDGILAAGGKERELRRIDRDSGRVVDAAVARSRTAGVLQAAALTTAAAMAALVALAGRTSGVDAAGVATALTVAGVLAGPLGETGRIVEFRQNFRAARRVLGPHLATVPPAVEDARGVRQVEAGRGTVQVRDAGCSFAARAGDRLHLTGTDTARISATLRRLASPELGPDSDEGIVVVDGWDHGRLSPRRRRELVGLAARDSPIERGTIARAVRYRRPDLDDGQAAAALERVGLDRVVAGLPAGRRTELRRGGEPLGPGDRARLELARAVIGDPPLLLLDRIDDDLDQEGRVMLARIVAEYPGVVLFASDRPEQIAPKHRTVTPTQPPRRPEPVSMNQTPGRGRGSGVPRT